MTQAAYARHRGVSKSSVYAAVQSKRIHLQRDGLVDVAAADRDWKRNTDASKPKGKATNGHAQGPSYGPYSKTRQERESIDVQVRRLELDERLGRVVSRDVYDRVNFDRIRRAQKALMAVANRIGPILAGISDPNECTRRVRAELEIVCQEMAGLADGTEPK